MNELAFNSKYYLPKTPEGLTWREKLAYLTHEFLKQPQIECPVEHDIVDGIYYRTMHIPANTLFIGRAHLKGHLCRLLRGEIFLHHEKTSRKKKTGDMLLSTPGYQMCLYTLTDILGQTVHPCGDETDIEKLEALWFEPKEAMIRLGAEVHERIDRHLKELAS